MLKTYNVNINTKLPEGESVTVSFAKVFWEKESYEQLLAFLINHGMIETEDYLKLWTKYIGIVRQWYKEKINFETVIIPKCLEDLPNKNYSWDFNFENGELTIHEL